MQPDEITLQDLKDLIRDFETRLSTKYADNLENSVGSFPIDFDDLPPKIQRNLILKPAPTLKGINTILNSRNEKGDMRARVMNLPPQFCTEELRAFNIGRFVSMTGNVIRVSNVTCLVVCLEFECNKCGERQRKDFPDGRLEYPTKCAGRCRSRSFTPIHESATTVDSQKIKLQQQSDDSMGAVPLSVEVELRDELVDYVVPGDVVTVCGVVMKDIDQNKNGRGRRGGGGAPKTKRRRVDGENAQPSAAAGNSGDVGIYGLYLYANSLQCQQLTTADDVSKILSQANGAQPLAKLVASFCPGVVPINAETLLAKVGMLLALVGGAQPESEAETTGNGRPDTTRASINVLIVGDPGLGKSQMLRCIPALAERGVYVSGNTSSAAGLTATVVKDSTGSYTLEAGALLLSDRGICCIDEFDKMPTQHQALLETMEQQQVSIAKAGIVCSLSARASVVAAANPIGGHYDNLKSVCENIKMSSPLLSRFDLVFLLRDQPDTDRDVEMSKHIIRVATGGPSRFDPARSVDGKTMMMSRPTQELIVANYEEEDFTSRLHEQVQSVIRSDFLSTQELQNYLHEAKLFQPILTDEAAKLLKDYYLDIRKGHKEGKGLAVTTRQLESMIRLAQARAKLELMPIVTKKHACDIVQLMKYTVINLNHSGDDSVFNDISFDNTTMTNDGFLGNIRVNKSGKPLSKAKKMKLTIAMLKRQASTGNSEVSVDLIHDIMESSGLSTCRSDTLDIVDLMEQQCYVMKTGIGFYKVTL